MWGLPVFMIVVAVFFYYHCPQKVRGTVGSKQFFFFLVWNFIGILSLFLLTLVYYRMTDGIFKKIIMIIETFYYLYMADMSVVLAAFFLIIAVFRVLRLKKAVVFCRKIHLPMFVAVSVFTLFVTFIGFFKIDEIRLKKYEVMGTGGYDNVKIALVSDLHVGAGSGDKALAQMTQLINEMDADIVLICGDMVDSCTSEADMNLLENYLKQLNSKQGVFYAEGNHDMQCHFDYEEMLERSGVTILQDDCVVLENGAWLVGRSCYSDDTLREVLEEEGWNGEPVLDLIHVPMFIKKQEKEALLVMCGHTHGVQYYVSPPIHAVSYNPIYGQKQFQNGPNAITTSGISGWGFHSKWPSASEVVEIDVTF